MCFDPGSLHDNVREFRAVFEEAARMFPDLPVVYVDTDETGPASSELFEFRSIARPL